jgi:hypothetical protein
LKGEVVRLRIHQHCSVLRAYYELIRASPLHTLPGLQAWIAPAYLARDGLELFSDEPWSSPNE